MQDSSARSPVQGGRDTPLIPDRICCEGAATPIFIVHGHRLSSLYRTNRKPESPFIVPKILKKCLGMPSDVLEYLKNNETRQWRR